VAKLFTYFASRSLISFSYVFWLCWQNLSRPSWELHMLTRQVTIWTV